MTDTVSSSKDLDILGRFEDRVQYSDYQDAEEELERLFPGRSIGYVLLVAPPDADMTMFNFRTGRRGRYWNFAPYGLGTLATHLRNLEVNVEILNLNNVVLKACNNSQDEENFDFNGIWKEALVAALESRRPN